MMRSPLPLPPPPFPPPPGASADEKRAYENALAAHKSLVRERAEFAKTDLAIMLVITAIVGFLCIAVVAALLWETFGINGPLGAMLAISVLVLAILRVRQWL